MKVLLAFVLLSLLVTAGVATVVYYRHNLRSTTATGKTCGGFAGETPPNQCPPGFYCKYPRPMHPDASGVCMPLSQGVAN